jgi:hypothetical protein
MTTTAAERVSMTMQQWQPGLNIALEPAPDRDVAEFGSTTMTIALVGETSVRRGGSRVVECIAKLATTDELLVICGSDGVEYGPGVRCLVAGLRGMLPRHTIIALDIASHRWLPKGNADLLDELMEVGSLPVLVAPATSVLDAAAELYNHLRADQVVRVMYTRTEGACLRQVWHREAVANELMPSARSCCKLDAA